MPKKISNLLSCTVIYGIGDILNRLAAFLLLPLYTSYLTPEQFGTLEILFLTSSILSMFLGRQLSHATLRFYFEYDKETERKQVVTTAITTGFSFSFIILACCARLSSAFSTMVFSSEQYSLHFTLIFAIILFELSNEVLFSYIRAVGMPVFFVMLSLLSLSLKLGTTIYFVTSLKLEILGVLAGNLVGVFSVWIVLSIFTFTRCGISFSMLKMKELIRYAMPLILADFGGLVIFSADKLALKHFSTLSAVGIYALGMRFAQVINFLITQPFTRGFGPYRFEIMKDMDAKEKYARTTTYFFTILVWAGLAISLLSKEALQIMSEKSYWPAARVVPFLVVGVFSQGAYYMFQTGVYISKNTKTLFKLFWLGVLINLILLTVFVPLLQEVGAAISIAATQIFLALGGLYLSEKVYSIDFEWERIIKIFIAAIVIFIPGYFSEANTLAINCATKISIILLFPFLLRLLSFYSADEIAFMKNLLHRN